MYDTPPPDRLDEIATKYAGPDPHQPHADQLLHGDEHARGAVRQPPGPPGASTSRPTASRAGRSSSAGPGSRPRPARSCRPTSPATRRTARTRRTRAPTWTRARPGQGEGAGRRVRHRPGRPCRSSARPDKTSKDIDQYFVSLLNDLGYEASLKTLAADIAYGYVQDSRNKAQMYYSYWSPDYTSASNFLNVAVGCSGFPRGSTASPNLAEFCDPAIETKTEQALQGAAGRPRRGERALGRRSTATRPPQRPGWRCSPPTSWTSCRPGVGNYQFNPSVTGQLHDRPGLGAVTSGIELAGTPARDRSPVAGRTRRRRARPRGGWPSGASAATGRPCSPLLVVLVIVLSAVLAPVYAAHVAHTDPFRSNLAGTTTVDGKEVPVIAPEPLRARLHARSAPTWTPALLPRGRHPGPRRRRAAAVRRADLAGRRVWRGR